MFYPRSMAKLSSVQPQDAPSMYTTIPHGFIPLAELKQSYRDLYDQTMHDIEPGDMYPENEYGVFIDARPAFYLRHKSALPKEYVNALASYKLPAM